MVVILFFMKRIVKIQSISDLITNSSSEAFIVYDKGNIASIKELVNSVLSLLDPSKTFDDYFEIEMHINYVDLEDIFDTYCGKEDLYEDYPELKKYSLLEDSEQYLESLPTETIKKYFDLYNDKSFDRFYYMYEGFSISAKIKDPIVEKVAAVVNRVDCIFDVDCSYDY